MSGNLALAMFPMAGEMTQQQYEDIPQPRLELHLHVATKFIQLGGMAGLVVVGPLLGAYRGRSLLAAGAGAVRGARRGALGGAVVGPVMTELAVRGQEDDRIYSRAHRIRYNQGQMRTDRLFFSGSLGGLALGGLLGPGALTGAVLGGLAGCLTAGLTNPMVL